MTERSKEDLVDDAKLRVRQVTAAEALKHPDADRVMLDVREANEWNIARIPGAVFIPLALVEEEVAAAIPRETRVLIYCARGNRSALAADTMQRMGYTDVASMADGIRGWVDAGGEIE